MYKQNQYEILTNTKIANCVYKMVLTGDTQYLTQPGQFINIALEGKYLRRPISVCDYDNSTITIIYKVVGDGTEQMSQMRQGERLDVLTGLGNGFDLTKGGIKPLLIGGGVGVPPLYLLAKQLLAEGKKPIVILGFNTASEVFYESEFRALGCTTYLTTVDGTAGEQGYVTSIMEAGTLDFDYFYTCGPLPMLKAVAYATNVSGQLSFEERMGCGFGACVGCNCETKYGNKRICRDGPVLEKEEIIW